MPTTDRLRQIAYVTTEDRFEATLDFWHRTTGAGPFYLGNFDLEEQYYRSERSHSTWTNALTFLGNTQIEIITPTNDAPSPVTDWLRSADHVPDAGIFHHILLDAEAGTYDEARNRMLDNGGTPGFDLVLGDGRRVCYVDMAKSFGSYIEIAERTPASSLFVDMMRNVCETWDGKTQPRRSFDELFQQAVAVVEGQKS